MGRKRDRVWRWRLCGVLLLALLAGGAWLWWQALHWMPAREQYRVQGVLIGGADGPVDFHALRAVGADFAYLEASTGSDQRDPAFARNLAAVLAADMPFGVVHAYDPCQPEHLQAANFVTTVPRASGGGAAMLPPVIALEVPADTCGNPAVEVGLEADLATFLNQVEGHVGQRAILRLGPAFEEHHRLAAHIERNLWLERAWLEPDYAGRPFTLWTANPALRTEVADQPLRWVVAQE